MDVKKDPVSFLPVRITEDKLKDIEIQDGYLYFTVDTQKIYLGMANGNKLLMGGSTGIFFGTKEIEYPDDGNTPDPNVEFQLDEVEGNRLPLVNDLILNIDGCFYRTVEHLSENSVLTNRLTLRGGGTGGGSVDGASLRINITSPSNGYYSLEATSMIINIYANSSDSSNYISNIECSLDSKFEDVFFTKTVQIPMDKTYPLDLIEYKNLFGEVAKRLYVRVTDKYGVVRSNYLLITLTALNLSTKEPSILQAKENVFEYRCSVDGNNNITDKQIEYHFYDENNNEIFEAYQTHILETITTDNITKDLSVTNLPHGSYTMKVVLTGTIGGAAIRSNELIHKVVRYYALIGQPIFSYLIPEVTEQYIDIPVKYLLTHGAESQTYAMEILVDGTLITSQDLVVDQLGEYALSFDKGGTYIVVFKIPALNIEERIELNITKYTGTLPVINTNDDSLTLYLTPKGRTNSNTDKEYWPNFKNPNMKMVLHDFYYRNVNGWMTDENGISYLKLNQGARAELPNYTPFDKNPSTYGLTIELDFMLTGILDYGANFIECLSRNSGGDIKTGFVVQGDQFKYYANSAKEALFSLNLVQNKRIRLSVVIENGDYNDPMCYAYLNGIISNAINYGNNDFTNGYQKANLKFNSTGGEIRIYSVRIYNTYKDNSLILNNYQASLNTLEERQASYKENLIKIGSKISLDAISGTEYPLQIPYVKITGGYQSSDEFIMAGQSSNNVQALPTGKKDFRAVDIEVIYPKKNQNPYFDGYTDFKITTTFENKDLNVLNGFGKQALTGAIIYAQGTSSLEYPVKNLRARFKGDKIKVRPDLDAVDLITFKADYMESSGSHNTGAANLIDAIYAPMGMQTPGQQHFDNTVTCIKGHPCVIFWSKDGKDYEYIGKYNLNLDKATPEPFGFKHDDSDFGYEKDFNGNLIYNEDGKKIDSIYCFEFLDNNAKVCNFLPDDIAKSNKEWENNTYKQYEDTWYGERVLNEEGDVGAGWRVGFESRYPDEDNKGKGQHDADALYPLASWLSVLYAQYDKELKEGKSPTDIKYKHTYEKANTFDENEIYYEEINDNFVIAYPNKDNFNQKTYFRRTSSKATYDMESLQKFRDEYQKYFDKNFLLAYYIITEVLLMVDSRVKNMMIATWGKEHRTFTKDNGTVETVYDYIWYPIFYDMDTMLGLENSGVVSKNYYDDDNDAGVFNGDEVLWNFVRDALSAEVNQFYNQLEQQSGYLRKNAILPFFNDNQANLANEAFYNEDALYKYINPFRNKSAERLYAAQGNRSMMREWFVDNRIRHIRGKHSSDDYQTYDRATFRLTYPRYQNSSNSEQLKINASIATVPPSSDFKFTSLKTGYAGVKIGKNSAPKSERFSGVEEKTITIDTSSANGTEVYLLGINNLSSLGDLSDKYLYNFQVSTDDNNLKNLILGNHNQDYYNPYWTNGGINLDGFRFLEEFNLENCSTFTGAIDFTPSPHIKKILLNGSSASVITLPVGGVLEELRLPTSVTNLNIDSHPTLEENNFTVGEFDYELNQYQNDFSRLQQVRIVNCPLLDTYNLIKNISSGTNIFEKYCLQGFNWIITDTDDFTTDENGNIDGIKVLDWLIEKQLYGDTLQQNALIGNIEINVSGLTADEFKIYQKYHGIYPNVIITYNENTSIKPASKIEFYSIETIDENSIPFYSTLSGGTDNLKTLTSINGPAGSQLTPPTKPSNMKEDFQFNNWLVVKSTDSNIPIGTKIVESNFENIVPNGNLKLVPEYISTDRLYTITLYDWDKKLLTSIKLPYDTNIGEALKDQSVSYYNYRELTNPAFESERYEFKGWQNEYDYNQELNTLTYPTLNGVKVARDTNLYAYYNKEDAQITVSNLEYFDIETIGGITSIKIKDKYALLLQGKITLPSKDSNGNLITVVKKSDITPTSLNPNTILTHIYCLDNSKYTAIEDNVFEYYSGLKKAQILNSVNLKTIGGRAFAGCNKLELQNLPASLETVEVGAFSGCKYVNINSFGDLSNATMLKFIAFGAFQNCGDSITNVTIGRPNFREGIDTKLEIKDGAFTGYGADNGIVTVKIYVNSVICNKDALGFTSNVQIDEDYS